MEFHGNINLLENDLIGAVFGIETNFPPNPRPGRFCFKDKVLYLCTELAGGLPVWVPLTQQLTMRKHTQTVAQMEWTINHGLNTSDVLVQVYDSEGKWVIPDTINTSVFNQVTVSFSLPMTGIVIMQRGITEGSAPPLLAHEEEFTNSDTWVVNHGLGYNPIIRVIVGGQEVQPYSIVHNSTMQTTITFTSPQTGSVRCV
jgi:hypothetical protein